MKTVTVRGEAVGGGGMQVAVLSSQKTDPVFYSRVPHPPF